MDLQPTIAEVMRDFASQIFNGLMVQLVSIPVSMRVDSWVAESFPDLVDHQKKIVTRQIQDALGSLKPEVRKLTPEKVAKSGLTLHAAYALLWSRRWDNQNIGRSAKSMRSGLQQAEQCCISSWSW
jgi:hypothetical protein